MIELQRASAGSGKTYTLAKKYIWYLITVKPEEAGAAARLRTDSELADSARHILAMTFTNKATNEMQQRIVRRLFDLGWERPAWVSEDSVMSGVRCPDYLEDFICRLCGVRKLSEVTRPEEVAAKVAAVCRKALRLLLENYSDFKVTTIDSFFQLVLRTLAYETDNNEAYQVEIDSEFLSQMAVDGTLEEIDSESTASDIPFWVDVLMRRYPKGLSMFGRTLSADNHGDSPYKSFVESVKKLQNEDYKQIRDEMERYFHPLSGVRPDLRRLYTDLSKTYDSPVEEGALALRDAARRAYAVFPYNARQLNSRTKAGKLVSSLHAGANADDSAGMAKAIGGLTAAADISQLVPGKEPMKTLTTFPGLIERLEPELASLAYALQRYDALVNDPAYRQWRLYAANMPYLALLETVTEKRREYLEENNSVELSETSSILHAIIDESDTPFVYERLGATLNHFLIDEFQDTSLLQWKNMRPLLSESLSHGYDNLIIGDAKQSIYRFRNADSSLITSGVQHSFPYSEVTTLGDAPGENTNYRSMRRVVRFNNSFFRYLAAKLDTLAPPYNMVPVHSGEYVRVPFAELYANVVQTPGKKTDSGYVELTLLNEVQSIKRIMAERTARKVRELVDRGVRQKDIAVLVNKKSEGSAVIDAIMALNAESDGDSDEIRCISEQSLKVAASTAVKVIVGVLENMARGFNPEVRSGEERLQKGVGSWAEIEAAFKLFELGSEKESAAERFEEFVERGLDMTGVAEVMGSLQSLSIPAIVEAVVARFVPEEQRLSDAVFIAAFQDLVLEYCERHPTDIGSFLEWWRRKSRNAAIASPEDVDAVRVMTIHKSKGLEFECVIVPFVNWELSDAAISGSEWNWVCPEVISHPEIPMPPYMPVDTSELMVGTTHERVLVDFYHQVKTDNLNKAYVAFTRAAAELYILASVKDKGPEFGALGQFLEDFMHLPSDESSMSDSALLRADEISTECAASDDEESKNVRMVAKVGEPIADFAQFYAEKERKNEEDGADDVRERPVGAVLPDYRSVIPPVSQLKARRDAPALAVQLSGSEPDDLDPRSEGNLKHAVLERVRVPEDLPQAVRHLVLAGLLPPDREEELLTSLWQSLADPRVARWFDGTARVINERPIVKAGQITRRPDRILVYPDGSAEVVDYKFGKYEETGRYLRQIRRYVRLLAETGRYKSVRGYLWYVNEAIIQPAQ